MPANTRNSKNKTTNVAVPKKAIEKKTKTKKNRENRDMKPIVVRHFYEDRMIRKNGGMPRMTCIIYEENRLTGDIKFGISNFKMADYENTCPPKKTIKKQLLETATTRLNMKPAKMNFKTKSLPELHAAIRKMAHKVKFVNRPASASATATATAKT